MGLLQFFKKNKKENVTEVTPITSTQPEVIKAFLDGTVVTLEEVNDGMFSEKILGNGVAIIPTNEVLVSPVNGVISMISAGSLHAVGITTEGGLELLLHVGLDTVEMNGEGFECKVKTGENVKVGQPLLKFDRKKIAVAGYRDVTMLVITNSDLYPIKTVYTGIAAVGGETVVVEME